jgi:hypothetical protein
LLGGATVVSIVTAVGNSHVKKALAGTLTPKQITDLFESTESIKMLPLELQTVVKRVFVESFNLQLLVMIGFAVGGVVTALLIWKRHQYRMM